MLERTWRVVARAGRSRAVLRDVVGATGDVIDHAGFARLLRHAQPMASHSREPYTAFAPPSDVEIEHWRAAVFGR